MILCLTDESLVRGKVNKQVTNRDRKETNGDNGIQTTFIFQRNLHTNLNTCPTVSQVPGNIYFWISFADIFFAHKNRTTSRCSIVVHVFRGAAILLLLLRPYSHAHTDRSASQ
jgi:hypothetical protein